MKIITRPVEGGAKQAVWERRFQAFHYAPETFLKSCECHIVYVEGYDWIGFIAANMHQERWGKGSGSWYAHKTVVRLPITHPDYFRVWALVADHQAQMQIAKGRRFVCKAPADHVAYRDQPNSGWEPASKDKRYAKDGYRSHRYVGAAKAMVASARPARVRNIAAVEKAEQERIDTQMATIQAADDEAFGGIDPMDAGFAERAGA